MFNHKLKLARNHLLLPISFELSISRHEYQLAPFRRVLFSDSTYFLHSLLKTNHNLPDSSLIKNNSSSKELIKVFAQCRHRQISLFLQILGISVCFEICKAHINWKS